VTLPIEAIVFDFGGVLATFFEAERFGVVEARLGLEAGSLPKILSRTSRPGCSSWCCPSCGLFPSIPTPSYRPSPGS
jgi:hypothetical protein